MLTRFLFYAGLGLNLAMLLLTSCGDDNPQVASVEIVGSPDPLRPRESKQLTAIARDAEGNIVNNVDFTWEAGNDRFVMIQEDVTLATSAKRQTQITASTIRVISLYPALSTISIRGFPGTFSIEGILPENNGSVMQLTDDTAQDNWGINNSWPTTSRDRVLWTKSNGAATDVILGDIEGNQTPLKIGILTEVDFIALGNAGELSEDIMISWRENSSNTFVDDGSADPEDLGDTNQEENSVADNCLFFREGIPNNDIRRFSFADGLDDIFTSGNSFGPVIGSNCQAVWLQQNGMLRDINFFDGNEVTPLATDLSDTISFDFRLGILVFSDIPEGESNTDIFIVDTTRGNFQAVNITNTPEDSENFVKTDGNSVLIYRIANGTTHQIVLYDIAAASEQVISTNNNPKDGDSLQIDYRQAIWTEGSTNIFFHNGSGLSSGTSQVPLADPLNPAFKPYLADGTVTWVGNDGDDEIYIMK